MTLATDILTDRDTYFDDWGESVTYTQTRRVETSTITVIFSTEFRAVDMVDQQIETVDPQAIIKEEDIPYIEYGDTIVRSGVTYYVRGIREDDYGLVTLVLSKE